MTASLASLHAAILSRVVIIGALWVIFGLLVICILWSLTATESDAGAETHGSPKAPHSGQTISRPQHVPAAGDEHQTESHALM